jgi:hypothetical protein
VNIIHLQLSAILDTICALTSSRLLAFATVWSGACVHASLSRIKHYSMVYLHGDFASELAKLSSEISIATITITATFTAAEFAMALGCLFAFRA